MSRTTPPPRTAATPRSRPARPLRHRSPARTLLAALLLILGCTATAAPAVASPEPPAAVPLAATFTDDFNGAAGSPADGSKWQYETGDNVNNHELQWYTSGAANAALDGQGHLVITAKREGGHTCWYGACQYTSARLNTAGRFTQAYGRFESRMKLPRGQGMWPAFWMLGNNMGSVGWPAAGEIDIMENVGFEPRTVHGTLHGPGYSGSGGIGAGYTLPGGQAFADGFHTFAIDWAPNSITWSVDGNVYQTRTPADLGGRQWVYDHPFFMILNLAVGGYWPGNPDASTVFPQQLVVDYVHVSTGGGTTPPPAGGGTITGYGGKCVDVAGANPANGTQVQLYDCNGTAAQRWTTSGSTLRALGKCLDVAAANSANGTRVQLYDCNGTTAQNWTRPGDGTLRALGKCLDATGVSSANGTPLQIWDCTGGANQKWTVAG